MDSGEDFGLFNFLEFGLFFKVVFLDLFQLLFGLLDTRNEGVESLEVN